jgi:hypothetical protein
MKKIVFPLLGALLLACNVNAKDFGANAALEQKSTNTTETYMNVSGLSHFLCGLTFTLHQAQTKSGRSDFSAEDLEGGDYQSCITQYVAALTTAHNKAQASIKKPTKKAALKEHFILSVTMLKGIAPLDNERVIDYERRKNAAQAALDLQKTRLEAE